ncbi:MAG: FAD-dependent oxidoreductase [Dehalococcoidia bacterium]|nr:FAD-dependent oxidoreductase [Dehalococcoidia bacterium]
MEPRIGVYVCHCGSNIAGTVDCAEVSRFAGALDAVRVARDYKFMCSEPGQNMIKDDIKELGLNRVVVASCSPTLHEPTFRRVCQEAGVNPYLFQMANIREQCSWVTEDHGGATSKAKSLVSAAVYRVYYHQPLEMRKVPINPNTLVVGGGIAGIQAALEVADSGNKVYMVERTPSIGGHMAQLDKTFPTLDCSACILTPKMTLVSRHPNIELLTYSEVEEVSGFIGNFKVKIRKKARYVDKSKCSGCAECEKACPVEVPSEFNMGLSKRKAIYRPFLQAVPNIATIEKRGAPPCRTACPAGVDAQGYVALISKGKYKEALEVFRRTQPFAGVCGRICTHPCEADCERGKVDEPVAIRYLKRFMADYELKAGRDKAAKVGQVSQDKVAIIGSGPAGLACAYDLIRLGYPVTVFEAAPEPGGLMRYAIPEYRLPRKILENEISYIQELGVEILTNSRVESFKEIFDKGYKAVFMGTGAGISQKMGIPHEDANGVLHALDFLRRVRMGEDVKIGKRVAVIGGGNAAVDAARTARRLGAKEVTMVYRRSRDEMPALYAEVEEGLHEGIKIQILAAPVAVVDVGGKVSGIQCIRMQLGEPDESKRRRPIPIQGSEFEIPVDNVIIAVGQIVDRTSLTKDLEYTHFGTVSVDPETFKTNKEGIFAGGDVISGPDDVISAVAAGKEAAVSIDHFLKGMDLRQGRPVRPERVKNVPKDNVVKKARKVMPLLELDKRKGFAEVETGFTEAMAVEEAQRCLSCGVCSECWECVKICERGAIDHSMKDEIFEAAVGNIIVATGYEMFKPQGAYEYGYGHFDNVLTALEFERLINSAGPTEGHVYLKDGSPPKSIAIIHCVGSRDKNYHEYCSRVCCMYSLKLGHLAREHVPGAKIYEFYIDVRAFGKGFEEFYNRVAREGTTFIEARPSSVTYVAETPQEQGKLVVQYEEETYPGVQRRLPVDMVILSNAMEPQPDVKNVSRIFNINQSADGFFLERHPKLDPVATATDGVFVIGCCQGPKDIPDTVAQASAAAAEVLSLIGQANIEIEAATAFIDEKSCSGCQICRVVCPYSAIDFIEEKDVCRVNEVLCKGCGACVGGCFSSSISLKHFTGEQLVAEMENMLV